MSCSLPACGVPVWWTSSHAEHLEFWGNLKTWTLTGKKSLGVLQRSDESRVGTSSESGWGKRPAMRKSVVDCSTRAF